MTAVAVLGVAVDRAPDEAVGAGDDVGVELGSAEPVAHAATRRAAPAEMTRNLHRIGNGCSASGRRRRHLYQELRRRLHLEPRAKPVEGR